MKVAFIGLGIMGSRMASHLIARGYEVYVYNRDAAKAEDLVAAGAVLCESPAACAAAAPVVFTMLADHDAVEAVAKGPDGLFSIAGDNRLWVNSSTVGPDFSRRMAHEAEGVGYRYLDAPVTGTKGPAERGELVFFAGGDTDDMAEAKPFTDLMGSKVVNMGPVGQGSAIKLVINHMLASSMVAFSEGMALGRGMGLNRSLLMTILLNTPVVAPFLQAVCKRIDSGDDEVNFPLGLMRKDMQLATEAAYQTGVAMPSTNAMKEVYALAEQAGLSRKDFSAVFDFLNPS